MDPIRNRAFVALGILFCVNALNFFDRQVLGAVTEPLRRDWALTDTQLGWLGTAFILLYAVAGLPFGRIADFCSRRWLLLCGLLAWSVLTSLSGFSRGFWSLFALRLGIGVGEATCAPAATSLIGDLFRPEQRGRALSIFMLGLPVGLSLSYLVCGSAAQQFGWRSAFIAAGIPGLLLAGFVLLIQEPQRGFSETTGVGATRRPGSPYRVILSIPTMIWLIASGALHNFNMYAISSFLPALLTRYHGASVQNAGLVSGLLIGVVGAFGTLLGGWVGDAMMRRRPNGRMLVASLAILVSIPLSLLALSQPPGAIVAFTLLQAMAALMMYVYYPTVYSTLQDILEPSLRGTGMAVYFLAMYALGASFGPVATGWLSDHFAGAAAVSAGAQAASFIALPESFRAVGLLRAMYVVPALCVALSAVLFAGSKTVGRDVGRLNSWLQSEKAER